MTCLLQVLVVSPLVYVITFKLKNLRTTSTYVKTMLKS